MLRGEIYYRNAIKVCERLGTWVLYDVRDATDLGYLIGYMSYTIDDLDRMKQRATDPDKKKGYSQLIGFWRRGVRLVSSLDPSSSALIAERILEHIEGHPKHCEIPYYVQGSGHRSLTGRDGPPRRAGRPRTKPSTPGKLKPCGACKGLGHVAT